MRCANNPEKSSTILLYLWKFLSCNKSYSNKIDEELKNRFNNTFKFSNNDINKLILLLKKGVYSYEYMDEWEKFNSIQDGPFRGCSRMGEVKRSSSLKSATHILQR